MVSVNIYLNFAGTAEAAFTFYKSVFGGEFITLLRFKDSPEAGHVTAEEGEKIMHVSLPVGKGTTLMATDMLESQGRKFVAGNNFCISLSPESEEETKKLFNGLSAGGKIGMPMEKTFWAALFGMCTDKFGVHWMVNYQSPQ